MRRSHRPFRIKAVLIRTGDGFSSSGTTTASAGGHEDGDGLVLRAAAAEFDLRRQAGTKSTASYPAGRGQLPAQLLFPCQPRRRRICACLVLDHSVISPSAWRVHRSMTALEAADASVRLFLPEHRKLGGLLVAAIFLGAARQTLQGDDFGMARMGQADLAFTEAVIRGCERGQANRERGRMLAGRAACWIRADWSRSAAPGSGPGSRSPDPPTLRSSLRIRSPGSATPSCAAQRARSYRNPGNDLPKVWAEPA
jgi:hypothetical protein